MPARSTGRFTDSCVRCSSDFNSALAASENRSYSTGSSSSQDLSITLPLLFSYCSQRAFFLARFITFAGIRILKALPVIMEHSHRRFCTKYKYGSRASLFCYPLRAPLSPPPPSLLRSHILPVHSICVFPY